MVQCGDLATATVERSVRHSRGDLLPEQVLSVRRDAAANQREAEDGIKEEWRRKRRREGETVGSFVLTAWPFPGFVLGGVF